MVGETGLEPARVLPHNDLNVARMPFRHSPELRNYSVSIKSHKAQTFGIL